MSKAFIKELDELVKANILTPEKAQEISTYYSAQTNTKPNRFSIVVNILGALLAGLGIILVIAHNWDELSRLAKTLIAFIPLLIGQSLCAYTLLKQKNSVSWRECSAIILSLAVASCVSIIGQVYHIDGTLSGFLLTWMLLIIPLVYLMPSSVTALLYIAGITWYACETGYFTYSSRQIPVYYTGLLALILPHYYHFYKYKRDSNFFTLLNWMLVLSVTIVLGSFASDSLDRSIWVFAAYLGLFCIYYLIGRSDLFENKRLFANPFLVTGVLGILAILFSWSFDWLWNDEVDRYYIGRERPYVYGSPFLYITIVMLAIAGWQIATGYRRVKKTIVDPAGFSGFVFVVLVLSGNPQLGVLLTNFWILFVAIFFIRKGTLQDHLGILNFGLVIIALLATFRFFDDKIPFIWRGLFFLTTGAGFFVGNYLLVKKRKTLEKNNL
ncbi:MAG: DUF2157 domain-containing protein [Agriterribacter sp.]